METTMEAAVPARDTLSTALVVVEHDLPMRQAPWGQRFLALEAVLYSIRLPDQPGWTDCARCGERFRAAGPTGHANDEPICDLCLLECEEQLGMVLALVAISRSYGGERHETPEEHWEALEELGAFVRVYEQVAARTGPPRQILPGKFGR